MTKKTPVTLTVTEDDLTDTVYVSTTILEKEKVNNMKETNMTKSISINKESVNTEKTIIVTIKEDEEKYVLDIKKVQLNMVEISKIIYSFTQSLMDAYDKYISVYKGDKKLADKFLSDFKTQVISYVDKDKA